MARAITWKELLWRLGWTGLAAAFLFSTFTRVILGFSGRFHELGQPYHSTDLYLQSLTEVPDCSMKFAALAARVPENKPILIVLRKGSPRGSLMGMVLSYLAWPHRTQILTVRGPDCATEIARIAPDSVGAVTFCEMRPPNWLSGGVPLGRAGTFVLIQSQFAAK